ncbi:MAG: AIR synthase-related protein, partial [Rickettsiales bacterium]
RHILNQHNIRLADPAPFADGKSWGDALLTPTRMYVKSCLKALQAHLGVKALCHITGGGLPENLPRILPAGVDATVYAHRWKKPEIFNWLAENGPVAEAEMWRTFNCGIGMVLVVEAAEADALIQLLSLEGETVHTIGELAAGNGNNAQVIFEA